MPMKLFLAMAVLATSSLGADPEVFHGWSKDGTWLVYEVHGKNELDELYFCAVAADVQPSWPKVLNELDREDVSGMSCVHYLDPNKAPYRWKSLLVLPAPSMKRGGVEVSKELVTDGENPGFTLQAGDKRQSCYASGMRESSKLERVWFHPSGQQVAALIDGSFRHCVVASALRPAGPRGAKHR
jgi:hypothetical protein